MKPKRKKSSSSRGELEVIYLSISKERDKNSMWLMTFEVFYLKLVLNITSRSPAQTILELIRHDYLEML